MIAGPTRRRSRVQLSLLPESPVTPDTTWEALTPDERHAAVVALARVMAKSINQKEEDDE
jgi:hypothetical protein